MTTKKTQQKNLRDPETGLVKGVEYKFTEEGFVDWRAMIPEKFLVPNRDLFERENRKIPTSIEGLEDRELLILLGGIKFLAKLRGILSADKTRINVVNPEFVACEYIIDWIPIFETNFNPTQSFGSACAHYGNTFSFTQSYLVEMAENRAFVRCVRNGLGIDIVGKDEIGPQNPNPNANNNQKKTNNSGLVKQLEKLLNDTNNDFTFDLVKETLVEEDVEDAIHWKSVGDMPDDIIFATLGRIKRKLKGSK